MHIQSTIVGNLTGEPSLRKAGTSMVASFRIAASRRILRTNQTADSESRPEDKWVDADSLYIDVECWGQLASNVKTTLCKGRPVICTGYLITQSWVDKDSGASRSKIVFKANSVGLELSRYCASSRKSVEIDVHEAPGLDAPVAGAEPSFDDETSSEEAVAPF
ncbi:single-stranded DNA-binding protein [Corynebacterium diphtheriae]|uniref:single-stranded DNA-binding protein n=1 Tax=Corynebacterium diphtheriae TaxID=1717 RepID=UPI000245AA2D|nr:single-stranded DNA-binding protein [Corynebacterium diphtheriae]AEX42474.1 putative single-strand binding protein [Corynebacterium diphtheriae 31A]